MLRGCAFSRSFFVVKARFGNFNVPVANFAPDKIVNGASCFAKLKAFQQAGNVFNGILQTRKNPFISQRIRRKFCILVVAFHIHQRKARCIPNLVGKVAGAFHAFPVKTHIVARSVAGNQHKAQGIGAVFFNNFQRVDAVAERFAHLASLAVAHKAVDEYFFKRNFLHKFHAHNQHARNPEENNIVTGYKHAGRIELLKQFGVVRPAHGRERPQSGAEPGVQCVLVLMDMRAAAFRAFFKVGAAGAHFTAVIAVPNRNAVAPPNLAADAPVVNIFHPAGVVFGKAFRHKLGAPIGNAVHSGFYKRLHFYKPLRGNKRLYNIMAALAMANCVAVFFYFNKVAFFF